MKADAYKIVDNVYWVGVLDWDIRDYLELPTTVI